MVFPPVVILKMHRFTKTGSGQISANSKYTVFSQPEQERQSKEEEEVDGIDIVVFLMSECIPFALQLSRAALLFLALKKTRRVSAS